MAAFVLTFDRVVSGTDTDAVFQRYDANGKYGGGSRLH